jgi:creatinine amidohydrolase/Fe(II)-dependent formamide hydrolase-like protein
MPSRLIGELTYQDVAKSLKASSILCLPLGSMEQHGPHLPLDTDLVIAEAFTKAIIAKHGDAFDLWQLPALPFGLSREHEWAPGTMSLSVGGMTALLRDLGREIARSLPSKNLVIVNGHGGNRGILDALAHELRGDFGLNLCALHTGALMGPVAEKGVPEIHGGKDETSVMLAVAPDLVRREKFAELTSPPDGQILRAQAVRTAILDPGVSWPWSSGDKRLSDQGMIGDLTGASAEHGQAIIARVVDAAGAALKQLIKNQKPL